MRNRYYNAAVAFILLLSAAAVVYSLMNVSFADLYPVKGKLITYEGELDITINGKDGGKVTLPAYNSGLPPFSHITYTFSIPSYVEDGDVMALRKGSAKFNVFFDDELLFSYFPEAKEAGRPEYGYGMTFFIPLPDDAAGGTVRIETVEQPGMDGVGLSFIEFGDFAALEVDTFSWEIETMCIAYILMFMAFIDFVVSFFSHQKDTKKSLLSSAALLALLAMWIFFQSRSRQYLINNTVLPSSISNICIFFLPFVLYEYFTYNYPLRQGRRLLPFYCFSLFFIFCYFAIGVLSFAGLYSYNEALTAATAFVVLFVASMFFYSLYLFFIKREKVGLFIISMAIMVMSFLLELLLLLMGTHIGTSVTLEVLSVSTVIVLFKSLSLYLFETKERHKKEYMVDIAYKDALTGLRNRQSYDEMLKKSRFKSRYLDIFVIDANNLKTINDTKGHEEGNLLLKRIARALNETFSYLNQLKYRIGGDEFVVISPSGMGKDPSQMAAELKQSLKMEYGHDVIAVGYISIDSRRIKIEDAVNMADARMYSDKKEDLKK